MAASLIIVSIRRNGSFSFSKGLSGKVSEMFKIRRKLKVSLADVVAGTGIASVGGTDLIMPRSLSGN